MLKMAGNGYDINYIYFVFTEWRSLVKDSCEKKYSEKYQSKYLYPSIRKHVLLLS